MARRISFISPRRARGGWQNARNFLVEVCSGAPRLPLLSGGTRARPATAPPTARHPHSRTRARTHTTRIQACMPSPRDNNIHAFTCHGAMVDLSLSRFIGSDPRRLSMVRTVPRATGAWLCRAPHCLERQPGESWRQSPPVPCGAWPSLARSVPMPPNGPFATSAARPAAEAHAAPAAPSEAQRRRTVSPRKQIVYETQ
jgi:hypothetical protein